MVIAFSGVLPVDALVTTIVVLAVAKTGYEVIATPLTYLVVGWLKRAEGVDAYDRDVRFNPFALTG